MREMLRPKCCSKSASSVAMMACRSTGRDVVVADDDAALGGELADDLPSRGQQPGDGVRPVVVERADFGQVVRVGEEHTADGAEERGDEEERKHGRPAGEPDDDPGAWLDRRTAGFSHGSSYRPLVRVYVRNRWPATAI